MSHVTTRQEAINNEACDKKMVVKYSGKQRLLVDCDNEADFEFCKSQLRLLRDNKFPFFHATYTRSKSGNYHVYVYLVKPLPLVSRLLLQAALGSDRKHELLNYLQRKDDKPEHLCFLFETKEAKEEMLHIEKSPVAPPAPPLPESKSSSEHLAEALEPNAPEEVDIPF